jgi:hypothetical protein
MPLHLIDLVDFAGAPTHRPRLLRKLSADVSTAEPDTGTVENVEDAGDEEREEGLIYPITVHCRVWSTNITLYTASAGMRNAWKAHINEVIGGVSPHESLAGTDVLVPSRSDAFSIR